MKCTYLSSNGKILVSPLCSIIDEENYNINYLKYLADSTYLDDTISLIDIKLSEVKKVEDDEIEFYEIGTELFDLHLYKDRVEFFNFESDNEYPDWSCTLEEYKRVFTRQ